MKTQGELRGLWWATSNLAISILSFLLILMLFAIMSSNFYQIFLVIFGGQIGNSVIRGIYTFGMFLAFPVGIVSIVIGIVARRKAAQKDNKKLSGISTASIIFGALVALLGGGLLVFALFFLTY